ncbi:hypothetical protein CLV62_1265 [Dysgonomonas alginatilytica]|uniref:Uncharacterized protein n=1 Tax=Dysgonomonas alginatilytica TaxID=1605892 RepID=A0A2V3PMJ1_9BACT|nr:hypothetical protein CLV62_1265 [Dysgonomonas alginatilytica]
MTKKNKKREKKLLKKANRFYNTILLLQICYSFIEFIIVLKNETAISNIILKMMSIIIILVISILEKQKSK